MAPLFWMLLTLCPFVAQSESGDYDTDEIDIDCWSLMSLKGSNLFCVLNEDDVDICEKVATICRVQDSVCSNAIMESNKFSFWNLSNVPLYKLTVYLKGRQPQNQTFELRKMVKIQTPEIENATYKFDEAVIYINYMHDFVKHPEFEVEVWGDPSKVEKITVKYQKITIEGDQLRDSEIYKVRVRAKPVGYFDGKWTEWSTVASFKVKVNNEDNRLSEFPPVQYILLCIAPVVLVVTGFLILRWKKEIHACLFPDIPEPKATLAQIQRQKEHLPVSFSPEIFKNPNIYPVIYAEEKQFTPEFDDDQGDITEPGDDDKCSGSTSMCEKQDEDDQSLDSETSQMKMKLLDGCASAEDVNDNPGCQSVLALQTHSKDETYVTMSSLYKTQ